MATLTTYRQAAATQIGKYRASTATSSSTVSQLVDTSWPIQSTLSQDDLFRDYFLFRPSAAAADKTRIVATYTASSGALQPDKNWASAPADLEAYELHGIIEPSILHECINAALKRIPVNVEVTLTPADSQHTRHSLATLAWLTEPWQVRAVGVLPAGQTDRDHYTPSKLRGDVVKDGSTLYLVGFTANTTDTLYLTCVKSAYYHCKASGGAYGSQSGLALETDEAPVDELWVAYGALCEAWLREAALLNASANARMIRDQATATAMFNRYSAENYETPPLDFRPARHWGPSR